MSDYSAGNHKQPRSIVKTHVFAGRFEDRTLRFTACCIQGEVMQANDAASIGVPLASVGISSIGNGLSSSAIKRNSFCTFYQWICNTARIRPVAFNIQIQGTGIQTDEKAAATGLAIQFSLVRVEYADCKNL